MQRIFAALFQNLLDRRRNEVVALVDDQMRRHTGKLGHRLAPQRQPLQHGNEKFAEGRHRLDAQLALRQVEDHQLATVHQRAQVDRAPADSQVMAS